MAIIISSHLVLNPSGVYHFRIVIPRPLRLILGKTEVKKTLKTSNRRQAILMAKELSVKVEKAFQEVRLTLIGIKKPDAINLGTITMTGITSKGVSIENVVIERDSPEEEHDIARALLDAIKDHPDAVREVVKAAEENLVYLTAMIDKYCAEKALEKAWVAETTEEFRGILNRLVEILGDIPVGTIAFEQARHFKTILMALPPNMNKQSLYRGKSIKEVISMRPTKTIGVSTINKNICVISSLFEWGRRNGYVRENYFDGLCLKKKVNALEERSIFTADDLTALFSTPIFKEKKFRSPYQYWVPLIGLYTGARLEEICQLHLEDIRQVDDVWVFDIKAEGDRSLKTASSTRLVPVHSELIRLGLLTYCEQLKARRGETRLFCELNPNKTGKYGPCVSKWFNERYRPSCGVVAPGKVFHSFRHLCDDVLKQKNVEVSKIKAILGHKDADITTGRYGNPYGPKLLQEVIEQLVFVLPDQVVGEVE